VLTPFDRRAYTRLQFLRAVSHAVGSEKMLSESHSEADDDDDTEAPDDSTQHQNDDDTSDDAGTPTIVSADAAVDFCEVCLSWHRVIHASRWCLAVINASVSCMPTKCTTKDAAGCPLCRTSINMLLRLTYA